ncbi:MAG: metal-dependent hydrolase [Haloarculaceae archaeon]
MPSTLVHVALAGLLAAALLGAAYDLRALVIVLAVTAVPDLDAFGAFLFAGAHRALLHTFLIPIAAAAVVLVDTRLRGESGVRARFGPQGVRVTWVAILAFAVAGIGLDFVTNGVNALYPLVDQFYVLDGKFELSTTEGLVQTFVEVSAETGGAAGNATVPAPESVGTTENVTYTTGVNPDTDPGVESGPVERVFPVVRSGWQLLVVLAGVVTVLARFRLGGDLE